MWQDPALQHMCLHPEYLTVFSRTQHFIMRGDGPLPFDMRHYIAIMVSGSCEAEGAGSNPGTGETYGRRVNTEKFTQRGG